MILSHLAMTWLVPIVRHIVVLDRIMFIGFNCVYKCFSFSQVKEMQRFSIEQ